MAYTNRPGFRGDLLSCDSRTVPAFCRHPDCVRDRNRTCIAVRRIVCCVQRSLPCVGKLGLGSEAFPAVAAAEGDIAP